MAIALLSAGCSAHRNLAVNPANMGPISSGDTGRIDEDGSLFTFGRGAQQEPNNAGTGIGVNAFLWRGALDTISFMPLASADPFGGVIITDWYSPPGTSGERFKATVYILSKDLRSDGIRVNVYRQVMQNGQWVDATVSDQTVADIENKVLDRARRLRDHTHPTTG